MLVYEGLQLTGVTAWSTHTVLIGTLTTLPLIVLISLATSQPAGQQDSRSEVGQKPFVLTTEHAQFLGLLHHGYGQMVELTDFLGIDTARGNRLIDELIAAGLVRRQAQSGPDFFTLEITPQGAQYRERSEEPGAVIPPHSSVPTIELQILRQIESGPQTLRTLGRTIEANASTLGVVVSRLERLGQVRSHGIWERRLSLSDTGRAALQAAVQELRILRSSTYGPDSSLRNGYTPVSLLFEVSVCRVPSRRAAREITYLRPWQNDATL